MVDGTNVTVIFMNLSFPMVLFLQMLTGEDLKVRALRGDEYLKKLDSIPAGVSYTATAADLPAASNLQNLFSGANAIGDVPSTVLNNGDPSVIHGETVVAPIKI